MIKCEECGKETKIMHKTTIVRNNRIAKIEYICSSCASKLVPCFQTMEDAFNGNKIEQNN